MFRDVEKEKRAFSILPSPFSCPSLNSEDSATVLDGD
jgi:hypothetical protein